jgi:DNA-binding transcriptional MerR regulator
MLKSIPNDDAKEVSVLELLAKADAAPILGVSPLRVIQLHDEGHLRLAARTPGGIRLFAREDVERLRLTREAAKRKVKK